MSENKPNNIYDNPPDRGFILFMTVMFLMGTLIFVVIGLINNRLPMMIIFGLLLSSVTLIIAWYREYYRRPIRVEIREDELVLINRYGKTTFLPYGEIVAMGYNDKGGGILPEKGRAFMINPQVAKKIYEAYRDKFGVAPREWNGHISEKAYRRKLGMKD